MKKKGWKYSAYRIVRLLAISYTTLVLFACTMADRMIFMPPELSYSLSDDGAVQFGENKEFAGFYFPPARAQVPTLLWAHGNAEDAGNTRFLAQLFHAEGFGVMIYDYPGYGLSEGQPNESGTYRSADAAFDFLVKEKGQSPKDIVLLGQSVGGGPSTYLAEKGDARGLILVSPFKSAFRVVTKVKLLPWDRFDNWKRMKNVEIPLLVIHGDVDEVVPYSHGLALYERHQGKKTFLRLEGIGHNDLWGNAGDRVVAKIVKFVREVQ